MSWSHRLAARTVDFQSANRSSILREISQCFAAEWSSQVARWAHIPEAVGSNPTSVMVPRASSSVGRAAALQAVGRGFDSPLVHSEFFAGVAQLVEPQFSKLNVVGSTPIARYTHMHLGYGSVCSCYMRFWRNGRRRSSTPANRSVILERWPSGLRPFFAKEVHLKRVS